MLLCVEGWECGECEARDGKVAGCCYVRVDVVDEGVVGGERFFGFAEGFPGAGVGVVEEPC